LLNKKKRDRLTIDHAKTLSRAEVTIVFWP